MAFFDLFRSNKLQVEVDNSYALSLLTELGKEEQLPFAMSLAINKTMTIIRDAFRDDMQAKLNLRRIAFNLNAVRVKPGDFASKKQLYSILSIDATLAPHLARLVTGKDHVAINGKKYLPMPNFKIFGNNIITDRNPLAIKNLHLHQTPRGLQGDNRTFLVQKQGKAPVILQRTAKAGKGRKKGTDKDTGNRVLYVLIQKSRTPKKIDLLPIAKRVVGEVFNEQIRQAVERAVKTSRSKVK